MIGPKKNFSIKIREKDFMPTVNSIIEENKMSENINDEDSIESSKILLKEEIIKELKNELQNEEKNENSIKKFNIFPWIFYIILAFGILYGINVLYDKYKTYSAIFEYLEKTHSLKYEDLLQKVDVKRIPLEKLDAIKSNIKNGIEERIKDIGFNNKENKEWKKILEIKKYYTIIELHSGEIEKRTGGSHAWRINNPGRISYGRFSSSMGAIGKDGNNLAIFPSLEKGRNVLKTLLFDHDSFGFKEMTTLSALKKYSTLREDDRSSEYANEILNHSGISKDRIMRTLNDDEKNKMINIIEKVEEIKEGISKIYSSLEELKKE